MDAAIEIAKEWRLDVGKLWQVRGGCIAPTSRKGWSLGRNSMRQKSAFGHELGS